MVVRQVYKNHTKEQEIQTQAGYWYALRIRPYRTTENQIDGVTMVFLDIDALKRHAAMLESARNYAEAIVETVQMPLVVLNADLRVNTVNQSFYETFQVAESETIGSSLFELGNGQWNLPQLRSRLEDVLVNHVQLQAFELEHVFQRLGPKTVRLNACKLRQANNIMLLLAIEDITERQQLETERLQLAQEQSARELAEAANRAKDEFLSNLSHELRNPLNTMLGWAQLLRQRTLDEATTTRALEVMEQSARVQSQLIEDILDISRITSGKLRLITRPLDLRLVIQAAIEIVQLAAEAKNIQIVTQLREAVVVGDSDRLQQVLGNLLSNAIKFTPANGRIEVTLAAVQEAQIQITDTGQGIAAALLPHIFDRFRQGDSSTTKAKPGLGLGLSIVRHIVELHGGTVWAESPGEGQGATFTVRLPLQNLSQEPTPASGSEPSALEVGSSSDPVPLLAGVHILVVDDEADTCELFEFVLASYGAEVLAVPSARAALAALHEHPHRYDALLCDLGMPEEDGYWLIQQVRLLDATAGGQIPAAAMTAYASNAEQQRAIEAGFQVHVAKPVEPVQLALLMMDLVR